MSSLDRYQELELWPEERAMMRLGITLCLLHGCPGAYSTWLMEVVEGDRSGEQLVLAYRRPVPDWPTDAIAENMLHNWTHTNADGYPPC